VQKVIDEVGYRPNHQARALARGTSRTVGLIVSELSGGNPFFSEIILYFERIAVEHGYEVLISFADTQTHPDHVAACVTRMKERRVDGIAVLTFGMERSLRGFPIDLPMIYAGSDEELPDVRNVRIDYLAGMREAVRHLVGFGHQRVGYLSGQLSWSSMSTRYAAFRKALKAGGIAFDKDLVVECEHTWDGGALGIAHLLNLPKPPTAVLCCNDVAAIGAMKTLSMRGIQTGKDMALIGFDDLTICRYTQPSLSTVHFSPEELTGLAFRALLEEIQEGDKKRSQYEYKTRFVLRESTCAPNTNVSRHLLRGISPYSVRKSSHNK
jgi:LacI family transcriptional regulator